MRRFAVLSTLFLIFATLTLEAKPAAAYLAPGDLALTALLGPPPVPGSLVDQTEVATLLRWQSLRTPDQVAAAKADQTISVFRFADVVGPRFTPENFPLTDKLFKAVLSDTWGILSDVKAKYHRLRPYIADSQVQPALDRPDNASYPSTHSTAGHLFAILLASALPEKAGALFARGDLFALNRVIGGVHYPSDIEAGRVAAVLIAQKLLADPGFQRDFAQVKEELARGLRTQP